ncbi:MAG: hypothetical protein AAGA73_15020 [Pseudomonadota bacterium]
MNRTAAFTVAMLFMANPAFAADYRMSLIETGKRDYYCTITVQVENMSEEVLADLNGHFISVKDDEDVGRSKGASFLNVEPGAISVAEFETPNAPCNEVNGYRFLVGACRVGTSFMDQGECAGRIQPDPPITEASTP